MNIGIDKACFYSSAYYIDLKTLAIARGVDPDKYRIGLGQEQMAVSPPDEDIVTLAANAASQLLDGESIEDIDTLLFATESGVDHSKAAGIFVHSLLGLQSTCRVLELKQACYSATAGLQLARSFIASNPTKKVLLIASDIARYGLNTSGESSQGGGAVAMLLSANPRLIAIEKASGFCTEDVMDFWRPTYTDAALVDGKFSCEVYLKLLKKTWQTFQYNSGLSFRDINQFCYHIPIPRLAEKAHQKLSLINGKGKLNAEALTAQTRASLIYSKTIGNCYSASLYLGLISLLENTQEDLSNQRIGFYSYGSGAVAEYFSGIVQPNYSAVLHQEYHHSLLSARKALDANTYETFYNFPYPENGSQLLLPHSETGRFRLSKLDQHKRFYTALKDHPIISQGVQAGNIIHFDRVHAE